MELEASQDTALEGMDPTACAMCGSRKMTDAGSRSEGHRDFHCEDCHRTQEVILRYGKPVGVVMPGNGKHNLGYRTGEFPTYGLPKAMPCGCRRSRPWVVLLGNGSRVCRRHSVTFRLTLHYVKENGRG